MRPVSHEIIEILRKEIAKHDKPENKLNYQRFFKETLDNATICWPQVSGTCGSLPSSGL